MLPDHEEHEQYNSTNETADNTRVAPWEVVTAPGDAQEETGGTTDEGDTSNDVEVFNTLLVDFGGRNAEEDKSDNETDWGDAQIDVEAPAPGDVSVQYC